MRDILIHDKTLLVAFVEWMHSEPAEVEEPDEDMIERFLATRHAGPRHVPHCTHCGSDAVEADDYSSKPPVPVPDELGEGASEEAIVENATARHRARLENKRAARDDRGPAWRCKACGAFTPREADRG